MSPEELGGVRAVGSAPDQDEILRQRGRGPVKVVAAAGSGKTRTMALLFAEEVAAGTPVSRIMAVTFTNRAAGELRSRVASMLEGTRTTEQSNPLAGAWIGTFHQLVQRLLREQSYLGGVRSDLALIDQAVAVTLMEEAAAKLLQRPPGEQRWLQLLPGDGLSKRMVGMADGAADAVFKLRSTALTPEQCRHLSEEAYRRFAQLGDPSLELFWHRSGLELVVELWQQYELLLQERGAVDFDGLLRQALFAFRSAPALSRWCQGNFRLLIVDEYQDTSPIQAELIAEMAGRTGSTLFMVGDARQSIYAFRDAQPGILKEAEGREFSLFRNYRSREPILAAADHVIRVDPAFGDDLEMVAGREQFRGHPVYLGLCQSAESEAEAIAEFLVAVHQEGIRHPDGELQSVGWGEMAVLAPSLSRIAAPLEEALRRRGVPYLASRTELLSSTAVKDLMAWLRVVADGTDDISWIRVLSGAACRLSDAELAVLAPSRDERHQGLETRVRERLRDAAWSHATAARVAHCLKVVERVRVLSGMRPGSELISLLLQESGMLSILQASARSGIFGADRELAAVRVLHRRALELETDPGWIPLAVLLSRLEQLDRGGVDSEPDGAAGEDVVTVTTVHKAKGLEWPVVVLADCRPHHPRQIPQVFWDQQERALISRGPDASSLAFARWKASRQSAVPEEERRRVVYVAMTRASDLLLVSCGSTPGMPASTPALSGIEELMVRLGQPGKRRGEYLELLEAAASGKPWVAAWPEFGRAGRLPWTEAVSAVRPVARPSTPAEAPADDLGVLERNWAELRGWRARPGAPLAADIPDRLSYSQLLLMERCPRQFWFRYLARFPEGEAEPGPGLVAGRRELGDVVHRVLETVHRDQPREAPGETRLEASLSLWGGGLAISDRDAARRALLRYLDLPVAGWPTVTVEFPFRWAGWGGDHLPPLVGSIDRVARREDGVAVVLDYKSAADPSAEQLGHYADQLRLYVAALEEGALPAVGPPLEAQVVLLGSGRVKHVSTGADDRQATLRWARTLATRVVSGQFRADLEFPERPCPTCPYRRACPERRDD